MQEWLRVLLFSTTVWHHSENSKRANNATLSGELYRGIRTGAHRYMAALECKPTVRGFKFEIMQMFLSRHLYEQTVVHSKLRRPCHW